MMTKIQNFGKLLKLLENWDYRTSKASVAMTLAHYYGTRYYKEGKYPEGLSAMQRLEFLGKRTGRAAKNIRKKY